MKVAEGIKRAPAAKLAYVTPANQFPPCIPLPLERRLQLLEWSRTTGAWIFEDDYDSEFRFDGRPLTAMQGLAPEGNVIFSGSFSKMLFPSLRMGYVVLPPISSSPCAPPVPSPIDSAPWSSRPSSVISSRKATSAATSGG